jgi:hypothetical protein
MDSDKPLPDRCTHLCFVIEFLVMPISKEALAAPSPRGPQKRQLHVVVVYVLQVSGVHIYSL